MIFQPAPLLMEVQGRPGQEKVKVHNYTRSEEIWACLALSKAKSLGCRTWQKILDVFRSPARALAKSEYWADMGLVSPAQSSRFHAKEWERQALEELESIESGRMRVLIWSDPEYPEPLRHIAGPPILLYYLGDISLLKNPCLAVVGSRNSSGYGREMASRICSALSREGLTIVSGFAEGIDREAHKGGLKGSGKTIAVLGTGIDLIYPAMNRDLWEPIQKNGLIISEFSKGTRPEAHNFPYRNRIISGVSLGVLVVQAELKSGSMLTAGYALEQNREVFAVPGAVNLDTFSGCNYLIRQGAVLVQTAGDILEVLGPRLRRSEVQQWTENNRHPDETEPELPQGLSSEEKQVASMLIKRGRIHIDDLAQSLDISVSRVSRILIHLEILGVVRREPGMYFRL